MDEDFDQTQAIFLEDYDQETDEETDCGKKKPVAYLKVAAQLGFPEKLFPLFEGNNIIGRHEASCNVCIPLKALSREHACIEIRGESHLIYDKNSRNKTKRNKLYLSPDVRYELKNHDVLMFGDVTCKYTTNNKDDEGSETGSESEYQTANDVGVVGQTDRTMDFEEEDYDSDNSVDLLQPTQAFTNHSKKNVTGKSLLADDSLDERGINKTSVLVGETPAPSRQKIKPGALVEESGSETEDEANMTSDVPQTLVVGDSQEDTSGDPDILYAPTQACVVESEEDETDGEEAAPKTIFTEPTQAFLDVPHKTDKTEVEPTQTFVAESDTEEEEETKKKALQYAATQAYLEAGDEFDDEPTQTTEDEGEAVVETDEEDVSHLFMESTLAVDIDDFADDGDIKSTDNVSNFAETQAVLDEPTQAVTGDDATQAVCCDDATQVVDVEENVKSSKKQVAAVGCGEDMATVVVQDEATQFVEGDATVEVKDDATQIVQGDEPMTAQDDATQEVQEEATVAVQEDATLAVQEGETVAIHDDATVAVHEDQTVAIVQDATMAVIEDQTVAIKEDATIAVQEDATMPILDESAVAVDSSVSGSKQSKGRGRPKKAGNTHAAPLKPQEELSTQTKGKGRSQTVKKGKVTEVTSSQESEDGSLRKSSRAKRKSMKMVEMEQSMDDLIGIDKSIAEGEDYSPEMSETDTKATNKKTEAKGRKQKASTVTEPSEPTDTMLENTDTSNQPEVLSTAEYIPPLPKEVVKQAETDFLLTLPALQDKDAALPDIAEATQAYTMDTDDELPNPEMVQSTQPYVMNEDDATPPLDEGGDVTPPIEDVLAATQPYSLDEEVVQDSEDMDGKPTLISIPSRSPLKPSLVSPEKRKKSPSPKRVQFAVKKIDSISTEASENDVEDAENKPSTSKDSKSKQSVAIATNSEELDMDQTENDAKSKTKTGRGRPSVTIPAVKDDAKNSGRGKKCAQSDGSDVVSQPVRGRRSVVTKVETKTEPTKTRGRRGKTETTVKDETGNQEDVSLISDGESEPKIDIVKEMHRGRSRASTSKNTRPTNLETENKETKSETSETHVLRNTPDGDSHNIYEPLQDNSKVEAVPNQGSEANVESAPRKGKVSLDKQEDKKPTTNRGRRGRKSAAQNTDNDSQSTTNSQSAVSNESQELAKNNLEPEAENQAKPKGRMGRSSVVPKTDKTEFSETEEDFKTSRASGRGRKSTAVESKADLESENKETKETTAKQTGRRGRSVIVESESKNMLENESEETQVSTSKQRANRGRSTIVESDSKEESNDESEKTSEPATKQRGRRGKTISDERESKDDSQNDSVETATKQRGRGTRGKSTVAENESEETVESATKTRGIRNRASVVENDSKEASESESEETATKPRGRRGKAPATEQISENDTKESDIDKSNNKNSAKGKQRSSSQPPDKKSEESNLNNRRGRSLIHTKVDKDEEIMPPPKSRGRRGRKNNNIVEEDINSSDSESSQGRSRRSTANIEVKGSTKVATDSKKDKSFDLDVSLTANSDKETTQRGRSTSRTRNSDSISEFKDDDSDSKPVRGKRKRDQSVDVSEDSASTSKQSKKDNDSGAKSKTTHGRPSEVKGQTDSQDKDIETKKGKGKNETKTAQKRARTDDEDSPGTPSKKSKLLQTPQPKAAVGVGSPSLRRKSIDPTKPKVLFTGVVDEHGQKVIKDLGGEVVSSVYDCTHLVTDKVRRTVKFLCCLARGIPIVTLQWIESSKQSAMFVDVSKFQVKDSASEKQFKFILERSLDKAQEESLLQGYQIHVTKNVKPDPEQMKEIIECAGGKFLSTMPRKLEDKLVVVSCSDDLPLCSNAIKIGIPVVNSEFILTGILRQETSLASYLLSTDMTDNQQSSTSHRKRR